MSAAWVTKEWLEDGKRKRALAPPGTDGVKDGDRFAVEWFDDKGKRKRKKIKIAGRPGKKAADRLAHETTVSLEENTYRPEVKIKWKAFRDQYKADALSAMKATTAERVNSVFNLIEEVLNPQYLTDLTTSRLSHYQTELRNLGRAEATIKGHMGHLGAAMSWAVRMEMLAKAPKIICAKRVKVQKVMKGRPITGEEFERMLAALPKVVFTLPEGQEMTPDHAATRDRIAKSWERYLRGLWLSGLRLKESLDLWWDRDDRLCVDFSQKYPMIRVPAALEKGNQDRLLPIAPDFAEFLGQTPEAERKGRVFNPLAQHYCGPHLQPHRVGELISLAGKAAKIKVNTDQAGKVKFASAHDLRRSFGERWAVRVMPQVLMVLMRHESIETTMRYYVGRNAQTTAAILWEAHRVASLSSNGGAIEAQASEEISK